METIHEGDKYSVENYQKFCKIYWSPNTTNQERRNVKSDLLCQRPGELVLDFRRVDKNLTLHDISASIQPEISSHNLRLSITRFYEEIRNCTCHYDDGQLSIFSEQKKINLTIKFWDDLKRFSARGDEENLVRFLHAYCESINTILESVIFNQPHASQLASNDTLKPNPAVQDLLDIKCLSFDDSINICHEPTPQENNLPEPHETPSNTTTEALKKDRPITTTIPVNDSPTTATQQDDQVDANNEINDSQMPLFDHPQPTPTTPPSISTSDLPTETPEEFNPEKQSSKQSKEDTILQQILSKVAILPELISKVEMIPDIKSTLDNMNISMKKLDARMFDAEMDIKKNSDRLDKIEKDMTKFENQLINKNDYKTAIQDLQNDHKIIENDIATIKTKLATSSVTTLSEDRVKEIAKELLQKHSSPQSTPQPTSTPPKKGKYTPSSSTEVLDHDVLLIGDSNTHYIDETRLHHGSTCAKMSVYKIDQAMTAIDNIEVTRQPGKLFLHIGTNHIDSFENHTNDLDQIKSEFEDLFGLIQRKFPDSQIFVSEIFMRRERRVADDVRELNSYLQIACSHRKKFSLIKHGDSINKPHHLHDNRHLSWSGFSQFLLNIRVQMFKMQPKIRKPTSHFHQQRPSHGYQHYNRNSYSQHNPHNGTHHSRNQHYNNNNYQHHDQRRGYKKNWP